MITKEELCKQIRMVYPDVGACGIGIDADYDSKMQRWTVTLKKEGRLLKTYLAPGDAENCMLGRQCLSLAIEIGQLKDSLERMPGKASPAAGQKKGDAERTVCQKAPEFAEHYRMTDEDPPCDDGRSGGG